MGDPKKIRKKYQTPAHPWNRDTIEIEKKLVADYGLQKKKEIQIANSFLKKYKNIAKMLIADKTEQGAKEKVLMLTKLKNLGLLNSDAKLDDVLGLEITNILERRIQSLLFRKGLARSMRQARQFITHGHAIVGHKAITFPSALLTLEDESKLGFKVSSTLASEDHPERVSLQKEIAMEKEVLNGKKSGKKKQEELSPEDALIIEVDEDKE